jgi:hypothetical protein
VRRVVKIAIKALLTFGFPSLLTGIGIAYLAHGRAVAGVWTLLYGVVMFAWVYMLRATYRRGRCDGHRQARRELWASFYEGVMIRNMAVGEWLSNEADRDDPPIASIASRKL